VFLLSEAQAGDGNRAMASAVIVIVLTMAAYNVLAVIVLQASHPSLKGADWRQLMRTIATNPLLLAGLLGLLVPLLGVTLPSFLRRALESLGSASVPIALMCIGGSLAITPLHGRRAWIIIAALLIVAVLPALVFFLSRLAGLEPVEERIILVLSCCPTASTAFIMAREMGGDEALVSGSIALSTMFSPISLAFVLWLTA
jgi:predicted permease